MVRYTDEFSPTRGVRQGDPISPYLFVLAMERLGHAISLASSSGEWKPIKMRRNGHLSHLFFVDEFVLFGEASKENVRCIQKILKRFCVYSGHKVNPSKSKIYFSTNIEVLTRWVFANVIGFHEADDLGTYLRVLLFNKRTNKSTFHFVVEKVQKNLNGFDGKLLSLPRRVTLAKSMLLAIRGYFMQPAMIPIRVCEKFEQIVWQFVWGSNSNRTKIALIKWDKCCQSPLEGGLGLWKLVP